MHTSSQIVVSIFEDKIFNTGNWSGQIQCSTFLLLVAHALHYKCLLQNVTAKTFTFSPLYFDDNIVVSVIFIGEVEQTLVCVTEVTLAHSLIIH